MTIIWPCPPRYGKKEVLLRRMYEESSRPGRCTALREALDIDAVYWQELIQAARTSDSIEEWGDQANLQYIPDMVQKSHSELCLEQCEKSTNASPTLIATPWSSDKVPLGRNDDGARANYTLVDPPSWAKAPLKYEDTPPLNDSYRHFKDPVQYAFWQISRLGLSDSEDACLVHSRGDCSRSVNPRSPTHCKAKIRREAEACAESGWVLDGFGS